MVRQFGIVQNNTQWPYGKNGPFSIRPLSIILYDAKLSDHLQGAIRLSLICFRSCVVVPWFKKNNSLFWFFSKESSKKLSDHLQGALRLSLICFRCRVVVSWFKKTTLYLFFFSPRKGSKKYLTICRPPSD